LAIIDRFGAYAQDYDAGKPGEFLSPMPARGRVTPIVSDLPLRIVRSPAACIAPPRYKGAMKERLAAARKLQEKHSG
jgi:hypothetical protein